MMAYFSLVLVVAVVFFAFPASSGSANNHYLPRPAQAIGRTTLLYCRYGDARDHYFRRPFRYGTNAYEDAENLVEDDFPFLAADKCRLAKDMEQEIQYLRTLMDKCERCDSAVEPLPAKLTTLSGRSVACGDGASSWCRGADLPCIDTPYGAFCAPCPVGYDRNGTLCVERTSCR
ncbi:uncharacterized protein LOC134207768 [Armigeres subalbatus]|uniref:uncharacterized protein LOC134207768 n=1 Tax=Armigeres subalbatus TaxID=124917 RepID=UPI002ECFB09B